MQISDGLGIFQIIESRISPAFLSIIAGSLLIFPLNVNHARCHLTSLHYEDIQHDPACVPSSLLLRAMNRVNRLCGLTQQKIQLMNVRAYQNVGWRSSEEHDGDGGICLHFESYYIYTYEI